MTTEQIRKTVWLNRLYFIKLKLDSLYSLNQSDRSRAEALIDMIPERNNPEISAECMSIIESSTKSSEKKYIDILNLYNKTRSEMETAIEKIDDYELQSILIAHYLEYKTWNVIAKENYYGLRTVKYKHLKALDKLDINLSEAEIYE